MNSLSLYNIEESLHLLIATREELLDETDGLNPDHDKELAEVNRLIAEYAKAKEPAKVNSTHGYIRHLEMIEKEAKEIAETANAKRKQARAGIDWIKGVVLDVMKTFQLKRLEGTGGRALIRKGNGGVGSLAVRPDLLPDEYYDVTIKISAAEWAWLESLNEKSKALHAKVVAKEPSQERIRAALALPCPVCAGDKQMVHIFRKGESETNECYRKSECEISGPSCGFAAYKGDRAETLPCPHCSGSGQNFVPGAEIVRGEHVELR